MRSIRARVGTVAAAVAALSLGGLVAPTAAHADTYSECNYVNDWNRPTLKKGPYNSSTAAAVKQIQCLINVGSTYPTWLSVDGEFGPATDAAVRWVQNCNRTPGGVDGVVGSNTWLDLYLPDPGCAL
ncbi:peptidoglycan-binding domain-containing protein [Streptomyces sp. NPDC001970]